MKTNFWKWGNGCYFFAMWTILQLPVHVDVMAKTCYFFFNRWYNSCFISRSTDWTGHFTVLTSWNKSAHRYANIHHQRWFFEEWKSIVSYTSSSIRYFHFFLLNAWWSWITNLYDVIQTWKAFVFVHPYK